MSFALQYFFFRCEVYIYFNRKLLCGGQRKPVGKYYDCCAMLSFKLIYFTLMCVSYLDINNLSAYGKREVRIFA